jgi:hypothetical protein
VLVLSIVCIAILERLKMALVRSLAKLVVKDNIKMHPATKRVLVAHLDPTPSKKGPPHALNAHPERMPILLVPLIAKIVTLIPTNRNPMLRNAF